MIRKITGILFWAVIAAAFIGPGTVTTAARAGAEYGYALAWTLVFSTIACIILQESAARIRILTGLSLGRALKVRFSGRRSFIWMVLLVSGAILLGSAAYEAGNILGAVAGIRMLGNAPSWIWVTALGLLAAFLMYSGREATVARILGGIVALMGIAFLTVAIASRPDPGKLIHGSLVPVFPDTGLSALLIIGLVGTTIVPYNLFLGSGIPPQTSSIRDMRFGLSLAILLGGIISLAVLIVGASVQGNFGYDTLVDALAGQLGKSAAVIFGIGMLGAGFTSAVTAPMASAIMARDLIGSPKDIKWERGGRAFRLTWAVVLVTGLVFGYLGVKPIPAIILAQALNGLILPFIGSFLFMLLNDPVVMGRENINTAGNNILMFLVTTITWILGLWQLLAVIFRIAGTGAGNEVIRILFVIIVSVAVNGYLTRRFLRMHKNGDR